MILTYTLSRTISKILLTLGQIFAVNRRVPLFNAINSGIKISLRETRNIALQYAVKRIVISVTIQAWTASVTYIQMDRLPHSKCHAYVQCVANQPIKQSFAAVVPRTMPRITGCY